MRIHFEPRPKIHFPRNVPIFMHERRKVHQIQVKQFIKRPAVAHHESPAKSPVDIIHNGFLALAFVPAPWNRYEFGGPLIRRHQFHPVRRAWFVLEYMRQVEIYPRKMACPEWIVIDRAHNELDFHIHQTQKQKRIFHVIARGGQIVFIRRAYFICPRAGIIHIS